MTLFIGRFAACMGFDAKKVVAFSTLSHLGFMFCSLSANLVKYRFFHLIVHALSKALLFISVGMLIFFKNHSQDFRQIGKNKTKLYFIWLSIICVFSLCGMPFFSGFFSKDFIIEIFFWKNNFLKLFIILISIFFSVLYRYRLVYIFLKIK